MISSKAFKKLAALTAAVALVGSFAVSASAATVETSTTYTNGKADVTVNVTVSDVAQGTEVTYYAYEGSSVIHLDQDAADSSNTATFEFVTAASNLESSVIVGYASETPSADSKVIEGNTITINGEPLDVVLPTEETGYTATDVAYTLKGENTTVATAATVTGAESATVTETATGVYSVAIAGITGDVTVTFVEETQVVEPNTTGKWIAAGFITNADGYKQVTVIGKITEPVSGKAYGAIIGSEEYEAKALANDAGYFVVQFIDEVGETLAEATVNTGVYYEKGSETLTDTDHSITLQ